jgi:hypothetical protein
MGTKLTHLEEDKGTKLTYLEEYKALRDEIKLCQGEMHRTWLWASAAAGAVYTGLYLHWKEVNTDIPSNIFLHKVVWLSPPILLFFCAVRYFVFWRRVRHLARYVLQLEDHAFPCDKGPLGVAHWCDSGWWWKALAVIGASSFWLVLILGSWLFSQELSQKKPPPVQPPPSTNSTPVVSSPAASSPATSQPPHKP